MSNIQGALSIKEKEGHSNINYRKYYMQLNISNNLHYRTLRPHQNVWQHLRSAYLQHLKHITSFIHVFITISVPGTHWLFTQSRFCSTRRMMHALYAGASYFTMYCMSPRACAHRYSRQLRLAILSTTLVFPFFSISLILFTFAVCQ